MVDQDEYHFYHMSANWVDIVRFLSQAICMYLPQNIMRVSHQHLRQIDTDCDCDTFFEFCCDWDPNKMNAFLEHQEMNSIKASLVYDGEDLFRFHTFPRFPNGVPNEVEGDPV